MGSILSRRIAGVEDIDIQANSAYRFPPKSGNYFASHFFMGGEKFDTPHPEGYLFGENMDLNFLGNRPVQFPYVTPAPHEPVKTLRSLVNIRKDSLRLVSFTCNEIMLDKSCGKPKVQYGVEFTFDADARVAITLYCQAFEEFSNGMAVYSPKDPSMVSETVHYKRGVSQQFSMPAFKIDFSEWKEEDLNFDLDRGVFPMVIQAVVDEGDDCLGHAHVLLAAFERHVDGSFSVKPLKQKQIVDRVSYLLQEIYGIENKNNQETKPSDDENSDNSNECVVCLSDLRDTLILPCRHLCLCNSCADTLRYQANNCPICRLPFRALLQIRAVRKKPGALSPVSFSPVLAQTMDHDEHSSTDSVPPGFEPISLLEALNGLRSVSPAIPSAPLYDEINFSGGLGGDSRQLSSPEHLSDGSLQKGKLQTKTLTRAFPFFFQATATEDVAESLSPDDGKFSHLGLSSQLCVLSGTDTVALLGHPEDRMHSGGDMLQDCSSEHSSLTKTESDPPGDLSLPGEKSGISRNKKKKTAPVNRREMTDKERSAICIVHVISLCTHLFIVQACTFSYQITLNQSVKCELHLLNLSGSCLFLTLLSGL
uniref:E3 ubiquitin-protein ligase n=1 Tax=Mastacembelus armatus TaxID=205130 RepID=A0A7N8X2I8_9TELE